MLTNVVGRSAPFQRTTEPLIKFVPVRVSVKPAPPVGALLGLSCVSVGTGFGGGVTVKVLVCTSLQFGLLSVIGPVTALIGTVAVICVSLLMVKVAGTLLVNLTPVTPVKPIPVIVTVLPTMPLVGLMPLTVWH